MFSSAGSRHWRGEWHHYESCWTQQCRTGPHTGEKTRRKWSASCSVTSTALLFISETFFFFSPFGWTLMVWVVLRNQDLLLGLSLGLEDRASGVMHNTTQDRVWSDSSFRFTEAICFIMMLNYRKSETWKAVVRCSKYIFRAWNEKNEELDSMLQMACILKCKVILALRLL